MSAAGPDLGALLAGLGAGGGGAPPDAGPGPGGPPPDLAGLLGGGGPPQGPDQGGGDEDPVAILGDMLALAQEYLGVEPDEEDKLLMQKVTTLLQQLRAKDQSDKDGALGGSNMRVFRKAG